MIEESTFKYFRPPKYGLDHIIGLCEALSKACIGNKEILYGSKRLFEYNEELIKELLNQMSPENAIFILISKEGEEIDFPNVEIFLKTRYLIEGYYLIIYSYYINRNVFYSNNLFFKNRFEFKAGSNFKECSSISGVQASRLETSCTN